MTCISIPNGFICSGMNPPTEDSECREFGYSMGRACAKCPIECYRNGMSAKEALKDNKERCHAKDGRESGGNKMKCAACGREWNQDHDNFYWHPISTCSLSEVCVSAPVVEAINAAIEAAKKRDGTKCKHYADDGGFCNTTVYDGAGKGFEACPCAAWEEK